MDINSFLSDYCIIVIGLGTLFGGLGAFVSMLVGYCLGSLLTTFQRITH